MIMRFFGAVYLILLSGERVLLLRRANTGFEDGNYSLIAGHVEFGESALAAMVREASEEAGITLTPDDLTYAHTQHRRSAEGRTYFDLYFVARRWLGEPQNVEPAKCDDMRWFRLADLPPNLTPFVRLVLAEHMPRGSAYSEWGWTQPDSC
jgi:8-oxo-dGTP pyrophosphatase MutT (NUDIX family)